MTTMRIGGPARWFLSARNVDELKGALAWAEGEELPVFIVGLGSNLIVDDCGYPGLVIRLTGEFREARTETRQGLIIAGGAVPMTKLGRGMTKAGYGDFLFMVGIPGTVGAGVRINAGTKEGDIAGVFKWAEVYGTEGKIMRLDSKKLAFGYRHSELCQCPGVVVLSAAFTLGHKEDANEVAQRVRSHLADRRQREPGEPRNCGSMFKAAPDGTPAGLLIDKAGLKGRRVGDAMISHEHANWFVNVGEASAADVRKLVDIARFEVLEKFGVELEREVVYVPQDQRQLKLGLSPCTL